MFEQLLEEQMFEWLDQQWKEMFEDWMEAQQWKEIFQWLDQHWKNMFGNWMEAQQQKEMFEWLYQWWNEYFEDWMEASQWKEMFQWLDQWWNEYFGDWMATFFLEEVEGFGAQGECRHFLGWFPIKIILYILKCLHSTCFHSFHFL